jgi:hypothetical protein
VNLLRGFRWPIGWIKREEFGKVLDCAEFDSVIKRWIITS